MTAQALIPLGIRLKPVVTRALERMASGAGQDVADYAATVLSEHAAAAINDAKMVEQIKAEADLKRSAGGIVDIEFMVQYLVLAHAHEHPQLAEFPDNVRILEIASACGVLPPTTARALTEAYLALRAEAHRRALDLPDRDRAARLLRDHEEVVRGTWNSLFA